MLHESHEKRFLGLLVSTQHRATENSCSHSKVGVCATELRNLASCSCRSQGCEGREQKKKRFTKKKKIILKRSQQSPVDSVGGSKETKAKKSCEATEEHNIVATAEVQRAALVLDRISIYNYFSFE